MYEVMFEAAEKIQVDRIEADGWTWDERMVTFFRNEGERRVSLVTISTRCIVGILPVEEIGCLNPPKMEKPSVETSEHAPLVKAEEEPPPEVEKP